MNLSKVFHAAYFFFIFFIASLVFVVLLSPYVYISPSVGISECASFVNGTFDPNKCNIIPGSLLVIVLKNSPLFSYVTNEFMIQVLKTLSLYFMILFVALIVGAIIYYYKKRYSLSTLFFAFAIAVAFVTLPLLAPYTTKDIICYKTKSTIGEVIICHTLKKVENGYVVLESSRYRVEERIPEDKVIGKVAIIINPPFGTFAYFLQFLYSVASSLWKIFGYGNIPIGYRIYYYVEP